NMTDQQHQEQEVEQQAMDSGWAYCTLIDARQKISHREYSLPINVGDDEDDDDDPDPEFTAIARASRRAYAEEEDRRRGMGTSESHLPRDDSRRSLPRSTSIRRAAIALGCGGILSDVHDPTRASMDKYLYRSRSVKQPSIKQVLKGVKATAKVERFKLKLRTYSEYDTRCVVSRLTPGWSDDSTQSPDDDVVVVVVEPQEVMGLGVSF
ncbi:hypothetical protein Taro_004368, partial [Colocasia esculenta]|nr:hypothetical protein [Colocasia esculenta]